VRGCDDFGVRLDFCRGWTGVGGLGAVGEPGGRVIRFLFVWGVVAFVSDGAGVNEALEAA
jgi:hypothetical protein